MNRSTTTTILGTTVLLVFLLPLLAFPLSATALTNMGGCHGHHEPMPMPSHSCCYARPQAPAQVRVVSSLTVLQIKAGNPASSDRDPDFIVPVAPRDAELSPPAPLILRI